MLDIFTNRLTPDALHTMHVSQWALHSKALFLDIYIYICVLYVYSVCYSCISLELTPELPMFCNRVLSNYMIVSGSVDN